MTDLQLGLLAIGVAAVVGIVAFNRVQELRARREAEQAFGSRHADALIDEPGGVRTQPFEPQVHRPGAQPAAAMPDERIDYVILLRAGTGVSAGAAMEGWHPIEQRFGARVLLACSEGSGWRRLVAGDFGSCTALKAALQLVSRAGVASDAEVIEFRTEVETLASRLGATVAAPEMRTALEAARALDKVCADADIQVAVHVVGASAPQEDFSDRPFQVTPREDGATLTLDVARTLEPARGFEAMARAGHQLAGAQGRLVDDNGNALDDRALAGIAAQLDAVRAMLAERGIEPGSPLALRLFS